MFKKLLVLEKTPIALGVLLSLLAWSATHVVDRLLQGHLVEYSMALPVPVSDRPDRETHAITLTNLSSVTLRGVELTLSGLPDVSDRPRPRSVSPWTTVALTSEVANHGATVMLDLQPGMTVQISEVTPAHACITLSLASKTSTLRLQEAGLYTQLVRHELGVVAFLTGGCFLLVVWYLVAIARATGD
jgi:hypothetical protein